MFPQHFPDVWPSCPNGEKCFSLNALLKGAAVRRVVPHSVAREADVQFDLAMAGNAERALNVHLALWKTAKFFIVKDRKLSGGRK